MASACVDEVTVPGVLKRLVDPSMSDSAVCCSNAGCTKTFADADAFERELRVYRLNLPYVPRLLAYDRRARSVTVERAGVPLGTAWNSGIPVLSALLASSARWGRNRRIRKLHRRFRRDTGWYHNDVCYKNVLIDPRTGRLYLIDFERAGPTRTDADADGILARYPRGSAAAALCAGGVCLALLLLLFLS